MNKGRKSKKGDEGHRPRRDKNISPESAIFLFGLLNAGMDKSVIERGFKLVMRDPGPLTDMLRAWAESQGENVDALMSGEPASPTSRAEVKDLVEPFLRRGMDMATFALLVDLYLFGKEQTAESILYAFYCGTRFVLVQEREPTKEEAVRIWQLALLIASHSKIGGRYWKELKSRGPFKLEDWIDVRKEVARKRFETFLRRKKRAEATTEKAFRSLMAEIFGDGDDNSVRE
jgi:hypothetical protein